MSLLIRSSAFVLLFAVAQFANAVPIVQLTWTDTTGGGATGGSITTADPGDELRLLISVIDPDAEIFAASLSLMWDQTALTALGATECPAPENTLGGLCDPALSPMFMPLVPGVALSPGDATGFDAISTSLTGAGLAAGETLFLGAIDFLVGSQARLETISVFYRPFSDSILTTTQGVFLPPASAILDADPEQQVPVPATVLLLGFGLLGLRMMRKRR